MVSRQGHHLDAPEAETQRQRDRDGLNLFRSDRDCYSNVSLYVVPLPVKSERKCYNQLVFILEL